VRRGYRAFLLGTATDQTCRGFYLAPQQSETDFVVANMRKWNKVLSVTQH
jgi:hypothetical protein